MIKDEFLETIKEYKLLKKGERVLVAVSGGADSISLLQLLDSCKEKLEITLHVAHLNHMIRKGDSQLDVRYVQCLAQNLGIPITVESINVPVFAKERKMSLELAAREIRYAFLERVADKVGAQKIAVGHTADDNVETFLMRLLRGAGLKGLCGIPVKRGRIIRPLMKIWRREIEDYVGSLKLVPRRDYTNYESKYMRNRVRLKLIPQLKIYNLNIKEVVLQTILLLTEDRQYLNAKVEEALDNIVLSHKEQELVLDIPNLRGLEYPIQGHLIRMAIEKIKGNLSDLSYVHVHNILDSLDSTEKWEQHLPGGIFVSGYRGRLVVNREKSREREKKFYNYSLPVPGEIEIDELGKKLRATILDEFSLDQFDQADPNIAHVDYSVLSKNLVVRNKQSGDRFSPLGMRATKKLQDLFVDEKIPAELRDAIPIVESKGKIVWVGGIRVDDRARVKKSTKKVVKLELL